jgi:hypothetical protein
VEEHILSSRVVLQEVGHIVNLKTTRHIKSNQICPLPSQENHKEDISDRPDLAADDHPAVLPVRVERDLRLCKELLIRPLRHGASPSLPDGEEVRDIEALVETSVGGEVELS